MDTQNGRDLSHLDALMGRLSREKSRLASARTDHERSFRMREIASCEKEIAGEYRFLGIDPAPASHDISNDELASLLDELDSLLTEG